MNCTKETLMELIDMVNLSFFEKEILRLRMNDAPLRVIGKKVGLSAERIRQIENKACRRIRHDVRTAFWYMKERRRKNE